MTNIRHALRQLAKSPGGTAVVILTLALGVTVNAAVFFFINDFFLRPLPARHPEELVVIAQKSPQFNLPYALSYPDFLDFEQAAEGTDQARAEMAQSFASLMAYCEAPVHLGASSTVAPERTWVHAASSSYFTVLGVSPLHGRLFLPAEGRRPGADPVIVLTHEAWRTRFASDPRVVGRTIKLNGLPFTVVGVTPPGFVGASWGTALSGFVPATMLADIMPARGSMLTSRDNTAFFLMGRLRPGATLEQARASAGLVMGRLLRDHPRAHVPNSTVVVMPENRSRPSPFVAAYTPLIVGALGMLGALVLAVAIANVSNLLYARAADRERELAIRSALGATRWQLLRQLMVEALLLATAVAAVGALAMLWLTPLLNTIGPAGDMPGPAQRGTDWCLYAFTLAASLLAGACAGLIPAWQATGRDVQRRLDGNTRTLAPARHPLRSLLVVTQVAASCVVSVGAGLGLRSLQQLTRAHLGFQPENLLLATLDVGIQRYEPEQGRLLQARLLERVRALPGVRSASLAEQAPFDVGGGMRTGIHAEGRPPESGRSLFVPSFAVEHTFLATAGLRVVSGRDFTAGDDGNSPRVVIINETLARRLWPEGNPIGQRLRFDMDYLEVVGIVGETRFWALTDLARPLLFAPLAQNYRSRVTLFVRTDGEPTALVPALNKTVRELDPDLPLYNVRSMQDQMASSPLALMPLRLGSAIAGVQGAIALGLAALGVYGLVSFSVSRRTREIGIRMALGARVPDVLRLVTAQSLRLVLIGVAAGLLLALLSARAVTGLLHGVAPLDAVVLGGVAIVIGAMALLASWLPARHAARVDPVEALRAE